MIGFVHQQLLKQDGNTIAKIPLMTNGIDMSYNLNNFMYSGTLTQVSRMPMPMGKFSTSSFNVATGNNTGTVIAVSGTNISNTVAGRNSLTIEFEMYLTGGSFPTPIHFTNYNGTNARGAQILGGSSARLFTDGTVYQDFAIDNVYNQWYWFRIRKTATTWAMDYAPRSNIGNIKTIAMNDSNLISSGVTCAIGSYGGGQAGTTSVQGNICNVKYYKDAKTGPASRV